MGVRGEEQNPAVSMRNDGGWTWFGSPEECVMRRLLPTGLQWEAKLLKLGKSFLSKLPIPLTALGSYRILWAQARLFSSLCCAGRKLKVTVE